MVLKGLLLSCCRDSYGCGSLPDAWIDGGVILVHSLVHVFLASLDANLEFAVQHQHRHLDIRALVDGGGRVINRVSAVFKVYRLRGVDILDSPLRLVVAILANCTREGCQHYPGRSFVEAGDDPGARLRAALCAPLTVPTRNEAIGSGRDALYILVAGLHVDRIDILYGRVQSGVVVGVHRHYAHQETIN